jgi:hypothetical protein
VLPPLQAQKSKFWFDDHIWRTATTGFPIVKINANKQFDGVYHSKTSVFWESFGMSHWFFLNFVLGFVRNVKIFLVFVGIVIEEVGQPIRRTSRPIRLRHFPHARTKLLASKIYIGLINTRYYFYNSQSTHWNGILKGKRHFPVYFDLSLRRYAVAM